MEDVALWHERDISHSSVERMIGPDATVTLDFALGRLAGVIDRLVIYPDNMRKNLDRLGEIDLGVDAEAADHARDGIEVTLSISPEPWPSRRGSAIVLFLFPRFPASADWRPDGFGAAGADRFPIPFESMVKCCSALTARRVHHYRRGRTSLLPAVIDEGHELVGETLASYS